MLHDAPLYGCILILLFLGSPRILSVLLIVIEISRGPKLFNRLYGSCFMRWYEEWEILFCLLSLLLFIVVCMVLAAITA